MEFCQGHSVFGSKQRGGLDCDLSPVWTMKIDTELSENPPYLIILIAEIIIWYVCYIVFVQAEKKLHWKPGRYSLPLREVTCQSWEQQALISPWVYWSPFLDVALMTDVTGFLFYLFACWDYCFPWGRRRLLPHTEVSTWLTNSLCVCSLWALGAGLITRFVSLV